MPIKQRSGADDGGGSDAAPIRRLKKLRSGPYPVGQRSPMPHGELGDLVKNWNAASPGTIRPLSQSVSYGRVRTGILSIDLCLAGGFKRSRAGMIYGERSAGKSTIMGKVLANALVAEPNKYGVIVDLEGTVDKQWLKVLGCDVDRVIIVEPATGEDAVDQIDAVTRSDETCFVGLDSVAMLTPFKEIDSSAEDNQIGLQARLMGKMLRRLQNAILQERRRQHHPVIILLNQFRMKAGLVFGDPRTLPGGKALEFVTSQQIEAKNKEVKDDKTGLVKWNEHSGMVTKDKTGGRLKEFKFKLIRDEDTTGLPVGFIDQAASILEFGAQVGLVEGRYRVDGINLTFKSAAVFAEYLADHPVHEARIVDSIVSAFRRRWKIED